MTLAAPTESIIGTSHRFVSKINIGNSLVFSKPKYCDTQVVQYSGYLNVGTNDNYFFWFFESRTNPSTSPLTVWLNGGPGCSSMVGLFQELGPCRVDSTGTKDSYNPSSWNQVSNVLFFDQPAAVGFSYGSDQVYSTDNAAVVAYKFLQLFYEAFPVYSTLPLHFFGESYGGHYIPSFANYIIEQNKAIAASSSSQSKIIPLKSIGVGNGWTSPLIQHKYSVTMACNSTYGSVLSKSDCTTMTNNYPKCATLTQKCYDTGSNSDCISANNYCTRSVQYIYQNSGKSVYDVRHSDSTDDVPEDYLNFLADSTVMANIGAKSDYVECSDSSYQHISSTGDSSRDFAPDVANLLNSGVRVLIYAGDADYICNWYGNYAWSSQLSFNGSSSYQALSLKPWTVNGKEVGQAQSGSKLSFVRIYGAGHEVPYYQPVASLGMFTTWINGQPFN
ncbi:hypothetical protein PHYBLDRAFT_108723 [Phycomyces blakesleeanus NRRL 1555(-)]|uniref:Carboxypeptidase n=2 Tax=Phycomyces blakesleeanus TaxID=4837 RepID=A0A167PGN0_PHYB8|nr:hypothetical protein PHYBLDRAFT_108723 [Phycomyces blakesleeanus NRRL 1555(-)]OAD77877.1 hypothetical protein PHYBLDRAFT_108723 [Phycomyces blakesleeanus NRRL 1555(-)]|eukprot:XP_018295917.1 hypothetical protein PHYBLDRAFT_108723 [Phycomyces blakesleeanus NRRL 1555(-)]